MPSTATAKEALSTLAASEAKSSRGAVATGGELERAYARIRVLEERLDAHAKARAELIHLVSHELRTPITVISGFARLLQNEGHGPLNEEQHRFVSESIKACSRLDDFVGDLLNARPGMETPFGVSVSHGELHESIKCMLESLVPVLEERNMKVEASLRAERTRFSFDARRIEQVISNLLTNAIRYGRSPGVIRVGTRDISERNSGLPAVEVSVEDDGPGIPEGDRERLFAPFVRGAGSDQAEGLGIGLALCRRIVGAHAGRIHVETSALGGARFVFVLPVGPGSCDASIEGGD